MKSSLEDEAEKRFFHYVLSGIQEFQARALAAIAASGDKSLVKTSGSIGKALAMGVSGSIALGTKIGTCGLDPGVGKAIGKAVEFGANAYEHHKEHVKMQNIETLFEGLDIEEELGKDTTMILEAFADIFVSYNIQFCHLLKKPTKSGIRAMKKLAKDSVHRIFDQLAREDFDSLNQERIINCFLKGNSKSIDSSSLGKSVLISTIQSGLNRGEDIETKDNGTLLTGDLFEKPQRADFFDKQNEDIYLYRHLFKHETPDGIGLDWLQTSEIDRKPILMKKKLAVFRKVRNKLKPPTQNVIDAIAKDGIETRDAITKLQKKMGKHNKLLIEQIRQPMTNTQAIELVRKSLGFDILDRFDIKISTVAEKRINYLCSDFESSSLALGFDAQSLGIGKSENTSTVYYSQSVAFTSANPARTASSRQ